MSTFEGVWSSQRFICWGADADVVVLLDACKTYELTWAIRLSAERSRKAKLDADKAAAAAAKTAAA